MAGTAEESFREANAAFVAEDYDRAVDLYTDAINTNPEEVNYYCGRSHALIQLEKFAAGKADAEKAVELNPQHSKAYLRKGIAYFHLGKLDEAWEIFIKGKKLDPNDTQFKTWLNKCEGGDSGEPHHPTKQSSASNGKPAAAAAAVEPTPSAAAAKVEDSPAAPTESAPPKVEVPMPTGPKTRYDWYQTDTHVVVTVLVKKVKKEELTVDIQENILSVTIKMPSTSSDYSLELDLAHSVVPAQSQTKLMASKVEIKLKKLDGIRWLKLEGDATVDTKVKQFIPTQTAGAKTDSVHKYPSSAHYTRDWDKVAADITREEKDEKQEGDAAVNNLFQQIYGDGTDETKKAMNKSFVESGGTVLSTNWKDIAAEKTKIKPPDGMEYKKYDQ